MKTIRQQWFKFWATDDKHIGSRWWYFIVRVIAALFVYMLLDYALMVMTNLPMESYFESIIFIAFLKYFFTSKYVLVLVPLVFVVLFSKKNIACKWQVFNHGKSVRFFVVLATGILAWVFSTYDFNLYFNQGHYIDRLLLLALVALVYWRPVFVFPFLLALLPVIGQFEALGGFSWAAPFLPIRILILFSSFYILFLLTKKFQTSDFIFFIGSLIAAHYWLSGYGKLNWEWIKYDQIYYLLPATYANGWLLFFEPETIASIAQNISLFNVPLKIFVLLVEVGGVFLFFHRKTVRFFLLGWIFMHAGIFIFSGICFWMWSVLDAGLFFLFYKKNGFASLPIFSKKHLLVSALLIAGGAYWCRPVKLSWHDVPVSYTYRFEATLESGETVELPPKFFAPFDYQTTLSPFGYLSQYQNMSITWGVSNKATSKLLKDIESPQQFFDIEKSYGAVGYAEDWAIKFDGFLKKYLTNWNKRQAKKTPFSYFAAPRLLWTFPSESSFKNSKIIRSVRVIQVTSFYHDGEYSEIRMLPVREVIVQ